MDKKAIALISGGLDSLLAAKVVMEEGIEVFGVTFIMPFASRDINRFEKRVKEASSDAAIPIKVIDISGDFLNVLKAPKHGYGANINPCIDCKILMLRIAKKIMEKEKAGFIVTGEVLGERPMSQRKRALNIIRKRSGLEGLLLRPLSAKLLEKTIPEKEGIINRAKLLDIQGRSRYKQMKLAEKYGIRKFFSPAGGCLLTDQIFSKKLKELMDKNDLDLENVSLLKYGRHFRLDEGTKVVVGRNEKDNGEILNLKKDNDVILRLKDEPGPYALLRGNAKRENIEKASSFVVGLSKKKRAKETEVEFWSDKTDINILIANTIADGEMQKLKCESL